MSITSKTILEYIWIDNDGKLRSKKRVLYNSAITEYIYIPDWNYDGSSTGQANIELGNTEIVLKPCKYYKNPLFTTTQSDIKSFLVLCDTWTIDEIPISTNTRYPAVQLFNVNLDTDLPWFGLEQEYFMVCSDWPVLENNGSYYCSTANAPALVNTNVLAAGNNTIHFAQVQRQIVDEHLLACINANLTISGINQEVAPYQWEFQIGPCLGIDAGDELYVARFLLERIAEKYGVSICYSPKMNPLLSGSGGHTNFSTKQSRSEGGIDYIIECMQKLEKTHDEHMKVYGKDNEQRLTGLNETAHYSQFSYGIGTRNTSVRIPNDTMKNRCGYFEDRRPAANMDPYVVSSTIYKTCCLDS